MKLVIFGATGGTGQKLVEQALAANYQVTVLVRNPDALPVQHKHLHVIKGDVLNLDCVEEAISGQEAVISALGSNNHGPITICTDGIKQILVAMQRHEVQRLVALSSYGTADSRHHNLYNLMLWTMVKEKMVDKERMEELVRRSGTDWTIVRPTMLTNGPLTHKYRQGHNLHMKVTSKISRADVADFMLKQVSDPTYFRKAPAITA